MRYNAEMVSNAVHQIAIKINTDPALIRNRMRTEPEVYREIADFCKKTAFDSGISNDTTIEQIVNSAIYGFLLREELAIAYKTSQKVVEK